MFVTCGICCNYCTVNMVTSETKSVWGFKDVDVYDPVSEKPPLKNIYYPSEAHCGGFQMLTSCSRTAIINSIFQSNEGHLCCITILFNSTRSRTMWRKWYICLIPAPFHPTAQKVASVSVHIHTVSSEQVFQRGLYSEERGREGRSRWSAIWSTLPRSNGLQEKRRDEEESGHCQSRSLSADKRISEVDEIRAILQM